MVHRLTVTSRCRLSCFIRRLLLLFILVILFNHSLLKFITIFRRLLLLFILIAFVYTGISQRETVQGTSKHRDNFQHDISNTNCCVTCDYLSVLVFQLPTLM